MNKSSSSSLKIAFVMLLLLLTSNNALAAVTFGAKADYPAGNQPQSTISADFNGDGKMDVATGNFLSQDISVRLGNGDGSFGANVNYSVAKNMQDVTTADFNGDGKLDLATADYTASTVSILLGNGDGTFGAKTSYSAGNYSYGVFPVDLNNDGKIDLLSANGYSNQVGVLIGNGNGTFVSAVNYSVASGPYDVFSADYNGDGKMDVVSVNNASSNIALLLGNGNGTFGTPTYFATGGVNGHRGIATDLNSDGKMDVVTANYGSNNLSVLLGNGLGGFSAPVVYSLGTGTGPRGVVAADIDGDGKLDLATNDQTSNNIAVLVGNGNGTFGTATNFVVGTTPLSIVAVNLNTDGKLDLITANQGSNNFSVLLNGSEPVIPPAPTGIFAPKVDYLAGSQPQTSISVDFNADGKMDIATANFLSTNISVRLGNGDGTFGSNVNYSVGTNMQDVTSADFNNDGKIDLATADYVASTVSILLGGGDGTFSSPTTYSAGAYSYRIIPADLNKDGNMDLISSNGYQDKIGVLMGNGNGTFATVVNYSVTSGPFMAATADLNGDGWLDIISANSGHTGYTSAFSNTIAVLLNNGNGTFGAPTYYISGTTSGSGPLLLTTSDFNGDGNVDVAVPNHYEDNISIFLGNGNGTLGSATNYITGDGPWKVVSADFNGDGKLDLVNTNRYSNNVSVLIGNGNGTFASPLNYVVGTSPLGLSFADFNGDNKKDVVVANQDSNNVSILLNISNSTPGPDTTAPNTSISGAVDSNGTVIFIGGSTVSTELTFLFSGSDDVTPTNSLTFSCSLDGGVYVSCVSPKLYSGLALGAHTFSVRATDAAGNIDLTPATRTWTVTATDTVPPSASISNAVDGNGDRFIDAGQVIKTTTYSTGMTFEFTGYDNVTPTLSLTYICSLDGGSYIACTNPKTYTNLSVGSHIVKVKAVDIAGNIDTGWSELSWTILASADTVAPTAGIESAWDGNGDYFVGGSDIKTTTYSTEMNLAFIGYDNVTPLLSLTYLCSLDSGSYIACITPKTYTNLSVGIHNVKVKAVDTAGNISTGWDELSWTILAPADTVAPILDPLIATDGTLPIHNGDTVTSTTIRFGFSATDNVTPLASIVYKCSLDGSAYTSCADPKVYSGLATGSHTFGLKAIDAAGNTSEPVIFTWNIAIADTTAPETYIQGVVDGNGQPVSNLGVIIGVPAKVLISFTGNDNVTAPENLSFQCKLGATAFAPCTNSPQIYENLSAGNYVASIRAVDATGNPDASPATFSWTVAANLPDEISPETSITSAVDSDGVSILDGGTTNSTGITFDVTATDNISTLDLIGFMCSLDGAAWDSCGFPFGFVHEKVYTGLAVGSHTFSVKASDDMGNIDQTPATFNWTVTEIVVATPPETSIISAVDGNNVAITDGISTYSEDATFTFSGTDSITPSANLIFECAIDKSEFTSCGSLVATGIINKIFKMFATVYYSLFAIETPTEFSQTYTALGVGTHTFEVRAKNQAGLVDASSATISWETLSLQGDTDNDNISDEVEMNLTGSVTGLTVSDTGSVEGISGEVVDGSMVFEGLSADFGVSYVAIIPAGATVPSGTMTIESSDPNYDGYHAIAVKGVVLSEGTTKSIQLMAASKVCIVDDGISGANVFGTLGFDCTDSLPDYRVKMVCPGTRDVVFPDGARSFSCAFIDGGTMDVKGLKHSVVMGFEDSDDDGVSDAHDTCPNEAGLPGNAGCPSGDRDNDGVADANDSCLNVAGKPEWQGCPYGDKTIVDIQIVDQQKSGVCGYDQSGKVNPECKNPLAGSLVKVFDREDANFMATFSGKRPNKLTLDSIYESNIGKVGSCVTGPDGSCIVGEDHPGKFLVIAKHVDGNTSVYTGKFKNFKKATVSTFNDEEDDADIDGSSVKSNLLTKKLHFLKTIKKNGDVNYEAGSMTKISGSLLSILHPEYTLWNGTTEQYPFVMSSEEAWTTDICMQVPTGYKISAIMDEDGVAIPTSQCAQSFLSGETKVVLFTVDEVGSPEPDFNVTLKTDHSKKKGEVKFEMKGLRKEAKQTLDKNLKVKIDKIVKEKKAK